MKVCNFRNYDAALSSLTIWDLNIKHLGQNIKLMWWNKLKYFTRI